MLILTRRNNESLVINNDIVVTVLDIRGDNVRLGVVCPKEVSVHRQEVHDAIPGLWPPEKRAFVQAIEEGPGDEGLRLVFADWLEEQGDPLSEFLRLRCRLARLAANDPLRAGLEERERALWGEHGRAWAATLPAALWAPTALPPA